MKRTIFIWSAAAVLVHAAVSLPHGIAHIYENAELPLWADVYVVVVILLAPFVALALQLAGRLRQGSLLLFASMLGALIFGIVYHFLVPGPDHVAHVPPGPWQLPFMLTSVLLVVTETLGTVAGAWAWRSSAAVEVDRLSRAGRAGWQGSQPGGAQ